MQSASDRDKNKIRMVVDTFPEGRVTMHGAYDGEDPSADRGNMRALQPQRHKSPRPQKKIWPCTDIHIAPRIKLSASIALFIFGLRSVMMQIHHI